MDMSGTAVEANERKYIIHPAKFNLWLFIVSIILLFGALTSAYIVSKGIESDKDMWHYFSMPAVLWLNTAILLVASVMLQIGLWGARKGDFKRAKIGYSLTMLLGLIFLAGQVVAWSVLSEEGVVFGGGGSNSGNYLYVLTCLHGLHIVAGLIYLAVVYAKLMMNRYRPGNLVSLENAATFWHFLGLLWLYLFIFLLLNQGDPLV
jgi:cytochrome c oxidase subunit III